MVRFFLGFLSSVEGIEGGTYETAGANSFFIGGTYHVNIVVARRECVRCCML